MDEIQDSPRPFHQAPPFQEQRMRQHEPDANPGISRREFLKASAGTAAGVAAASWALGCGGRSTTVAAATPAYTTAQIQVLPVALGASTPQIAPADVAHYVQYGYNSWTLGPGLPYEPRAELAPAYQGAPCAGHLLTFFAFTDVHVVDKESPAQPLYIGWSASYGPSSYGFSSAYSPISLATPHVLDAAVRTVNALHQVTPFDFGICLGDAINNTQYNELRWYIDVMDGKTITPSSGAHLGAATVDYQKPFKAAGLDPAIPWYQVVGNHDQYWSGAAWEVDKTLQAHVGGTVLDIGNNPAAPDLASTGYYMGVIDGTDPLGRVIKCGPEQDFSTPPTVAADPARRSLATAASTTLGFMTEFFTTTSSPAGHGFTQASLDQDFACYSFVPKAGIPVKVLVLDDTVKGPGQPNYALGGLDQARLDWLTAELQAGQDNNQLMIIAAHIPVAPQASLTNTARRPLFYTPGFTDADLLSVLHGFPNLIMWIAGHRHVNVVTPQPDPGGDPTRSFWVVETSSLRDFPQQFRTFSIDRNTDNTLAVTVTNVDPQAAPGSPADRSRGWAIGAARIFGATPAVLADTTSHAYNAVLVKQLTPAMQVVLQNL
jgi:metallophosphoesterase (TIGR03768 family)